MQIILASQNKNKLKELSTIFQINSSKHSLVSPSEVLNVIEDKETIKAVSYTHLRAHET